MRISTHATFLGIVTLGFLACATPQSVQFTQVPPAPAGDEFPNWPIPPVTTLEGMQKLDRADVEVHSAAGAGAGVTGAEKVVAHLSIYDGDLKFKVKPVPAKLDGLNNSPRKELAAYLVQQLFLDPVDFSVPTSSIRCVEVEQWKKSHPEMPPTIPGTNCVLVGTAFWLNDVTLPDPLYDEERFLSDPRYAYHLANFNLVTYLVDHHDNRKGNFLVSSHDDDRRVFAIDNGTTFGAWWFNWFYPPSFAWRKIQVPALPRASVDRLRTIRREDLDQLAVVTQLDADDAGILRIVAPEAPIDPSKGARLRGTTVQFGLTEDEIDDVWERIESLIAEIDDGEITVF